MIFILFNTDKEKEKEIWFSPMTKTLYQQKIRKPMDNTKTPPKTSITQQLRTDLGRLVGVRTVIQLALLNRVTKGNQHSHSPQQQCNQTNTSRQEYCLQYKHTFAKIDTF